MIELVANTKDIQLDSSQPEAQTVFSTLYYNRDLYVQEIPACTFKEAFQMIPTKVLLQIEDLSVEEQINVLANEGFYICVHSVQLPKKSKKIADGYSYPELVLSPIQYFCQLPVSALLLENLGNTADEQITVSKSLELDLYQVNNVVIPDGKQQVPAGLTKVGTLALDMQLNYPNPNRSDLRLCRFELPCVRIFGNLQNVPKTYLSIPPVNWALECRFPGESEYRGVLRSGYLQIEEKKDQADAPRTFKDLLKMTVPQPLLIRFPESAAALDCGLAEQAFSALYGKMMAGAKTNEKQRANEVAQLLQKLLQIRQAELKIGTLAPLKEDKRRPASKDLSAARPEETFAASITALRLACADALNQGLAARNDDASERYKSEISGGKKVKPPQLLQSQQVTIEQVDNIGRFPLLFDRVANNGKMLVLDRGMLFRLRQRAATEDVSLDVRVVLEGSWGQFGVRVENFTSLAKIPLNSLLVSPVLDQQDVVLEMTSEQQEQLGRQAGADQTPKRDKKPKKDESPEVLNLLVQNYATVDVTIDFTSADLLPTAGLVIRDLRHLLPGNGDFKSFLLRLQNGFNRVGQSYEIAQTLFLEKQYETCHLPPAARRLSPLELVIEQYKASLLEAYGGLKQALLQKQSEFDKLAFAQQIKPITALYKQKLVDCGLSLTAAHAHLMVATQETLNSPPREQPASELNEYGYVLLNESNSAQTLQSALKLFGNAISRERKTLGISERSVVLEQALLGEL